MPEPLLTFKYFDKFLELLGIKDRNEQILHLKNCVKELPLPHQDMIYYLFEMLKKISLEKQSNMMSEDNLAIVIAPNILKPKDHSNEKASKALIVVATMISLFPYYLVDDVKVDEVVDSIDEKINDLKIDE
jgi:hypothetical protein